MLKTSGLKKKVVTNATNGNILMIEGALSTTEYLKNLKFIKVFSRVFTEKVGY